MGISDIIGSLLGSGTETEYWLWRSQHLRGKGKTYYNRQNLLPPGDYAEFEVTDAAADDRIVIDRRTHEIWYTGDHYDSFKYLGKPDCFD